jgi:hypothetical protein
LISRVVRILVKSATYSQPFSVDRLCEGIVKRGELKKRATRKRKKGANTKEKRGTYGKEKYSNES